MLLLKKEKMHTFLNMLYASVCHMCTGDEKVNLSAVRYRFPFIQAHLAEINSLCFLLRQTLPRPLGQLLKLQVPHRHSKEESL